VYFLFQEVALIVVVLGRVLSSIQIYLECMVFTNRNGSNIELVMTCKRPGSIEASCRGS
jgi:hypothetical protein